MPTQRGFDTQLGSAQQLVQEYWEVKERAEATLRRVVGALGELEGLDTDTPHRISSGDLMLDYCLQQFGLFFPLMMKRYECVNEVLAGHLGELVVAEWNEQLPGDGFLRHFRLGILNAEQIEFAHGLNCMMPVDGYVTHEDVDSTMVHPDGFHEHFEFFVPADAYRDYLPLVSFGGAVEDYIRTSCSTLPEYELAAVIAGNDAVRRWFQKDSGIADGEVVCRQLEERLRAASSSSALAA